MSSGSRGGRNKGETNDDNDYKIEIKLTLQKKTRKKCGKEECKRIYSLMNKAAMDISSLFQSFCRASVIERNDERIICAVSNESDLKFFWEKYDRMELEEKFKEVVLKENRDGFFIVLEVEDEVYDNGEEFFAAKRLSTQRDDDNEPSANGCSRETTDQKSDVRDAAEMTRSNSAIDTANVLSTTSPCENVARYNPTDSAAAAATEQQQSENVSPGNDPTITSRNQDGSVDRMGTPGAENRSSQNTDPPAGDIGYMKFDQKTRDELYSRNTELSMPEASAAKPAIGQSTSTPATHAMLKTRFVVYVPEAVEKACLQVSHGPNSTTYQRYDMTVDKNNSNVWTTGLIQIRDDSRYYYCLKSVSTSRWWEFFKSKGDTVMAEPDNRTVNPCSVQRDIFGPPEKIQLYITSAPFKYYLSSMAGMVNTDSDVKRNMEEMNVLLAGYMMPDSVKYELIRYATECTEVFSSRPMSAVFILYFMSRVWPQKGSLTFPNIVPRNAEQLLRTLQDVSLLPLFENCVSSAVIWALITLVKQYYVTATWSCFAYWCYPLLSGKTVVNLKRSEQWSTCEKSDVLGKLIERVCQKVETHHDAEEVFVVAIDHYYSVLSKLKAFLVLRKSNLPDSRYKSLVDKYDWLTLMTDQLTKYYLTSQLKDIDYVVALASGVDVRLLVQCAARVEECVLLILQKKEDVSDYIAYIKTLISNAVLFTETENVRTLLDIVAGSHIPCLHFLFLDCLQCNKLSSTLDHITILHLLDLWFKTAKIPSRHISGDNSEQWFKYCSQLSALELFNSNTDVKARADELIVSFLHHHNQEAMRKWSQSTGVSSACQHMKMLETLPENLRVAVRSDLEEGVLKLLAKARDYTHEKVAQLKTLLTNENIFTIQEYAVKALEYLAVSIDIHIHDLLLKVLKEGKFWRIIRDEEIYSRLFKSWIETAATHSRSKSQRCSSSDDHILYLYQYLADLLSLENLAPAVKSNVELFVKIECMRLGSSRIVSIVSKTASTSRFSDGVRELLSKHCTEIESGCSLTEIELISKLDEIGRSEKSTLDLSDSYFYLGLKILLNHANARLNELNDDVLKLTFILRTPTFWKKLLMCRGSKMKEVEKMGVFETVKESVIGFGRNFTKGRIAINFYHMLAESIKQKGIHNVAALVELYTEEGVFQSVWCSLGNKLRVASEALESLEAVNTVFVQRLCIDVVIDEVDHLKKQLCYLKEKLTESSQTLMAELGNPGFFGDLYDIKDMCRQLYKLRGLTTFLNLTQKAVKELHSKAPALPLSRSSTEESLSVHYLYDEDESSGTVEDTGKNISYSDLIEFLTNTCQDEYKSWLELIVDDGTLSDVTRYSSGYEIVWKDIQEAAEIFQIRISRSLLPALKWLEHLDSNKQRVDHIEKVLRMSVFNVDAERGGLIKAIETFQHCFSEPSTVTLSALANTMSELEELLSSDEKPDNWWDTVEELAKATELIKFLSDSVDDDFRNLIDAVEERSEQTIDESCVSDLIRVKQFLQPVFRRKTFSDPHEFLECLMKSLQKETKMSGRINNCAHHLHGLKALYQHVANRGELTKEIIKNAMTKGCYQWSLADGKKTCQTMLTFKISKKSAGKAEKFAYDTEAMNDLRSRALLISTADKTNEDVTTVVPVFEKSVKVLADFILIIGMVHDIGQIVTELHRLGHFNYMAYHRKLSYSPSLTTELTKLQESLSSELQDWKSDLLEHRLNFLSLNYIFSDQLSILSSFFLKAGCLNVEVDQSVQNIVHFVHPGTSKCDLLYYCDALPTAMSLSATEKLHFVGSVLDRIKREVFCPRKPFPQNTELVKAKNVNAIVQAGQLFVVQLEIGSTQTIPVLLSLYAHTTGNYPFPNEVLFCHSSTTWEEIYLIIQRCIRMNDHELHCIANVERLTNAIQYDLVRELSDLISKHSDFRLAIICRGHQSIVDHFSSFVHHVQGFDSASMRACLQETWQNVGVVTSTVPGLGKTEKITETCTNQECEMKSVHISGPILRRTLVDRLKVQKILVGDVLHIDIGDVDDKELLDTSIFELIVLGCLCAGTDIVHVPTDKVFIEVANTLNDSLINGLVVMSCFKRHHYQWQNFENFVVSNELRSPVQIVCHYLMSLDCNRLDVDDVRFSGPNCVSPLPGNLCRNLLAKHFSSFDSKDLSFTVVEIFLNVFAGQLLKLSGSQFFTVQGLKAMLGSDKSNDVRSKLVVALMGVAKDFACRSVRSCRESQALAETAVGRKADILGTTAADLMAHRIEGMLQWEDTNHLLIVFHALESQTVSLLYRDLTLVPPHVKELFKSQTKRDLADFSRLPQEKLLLTLEKIARTKPRESAVLANVDKSYAITPDNVLKMVLILLRIKANIPVVIMGETGCGKTSLIRYLAGLCEIEFKHINIHAGITTEAIEKEVYECHKKCVKDGKQHLWLFLDEINSCEHMGLLTEIICHHSCFGKPLAKNLILLAACNPYRLRDSSQIATAGLGGKIKTDEYSKLVYRVHPLPETMIDYVWDYGTLSYEDEKSYIKQMVQCTFPSAVDRVDLTETLAKLLVASQEFMKEHAANSSCVSLRDVHRCRILVEFFYKMLKDKRLTKPFTGDEKTVKLHSIILALAHCYQSRLATAQLRRCYWEKCSAVLWGNKKHFRELMRVVQAEQFDLLDRMDLPPGIAKNTALCENVFVILVCILNRIPIFLVGKPGCSKSLSMQLIKSSLRGKDSTDEYFQTLPNLYVVSYQGSESSTSEGIIKVFEKAEKYKEANKLENVLPVVLLDEVGLAEVSKFNPLKVLHNLLEPKTGELPNVAVVGISNWSLDAAKMNRAIHLSRPDMDAEELYETSLSISTVSLPGSGRGNLVIHRNILRALAKAYYEYQRSQHIENFHGLRDYYALVKYVSRLSQDGTDEASDIIIQKGLLRNFGGLSIEKNDIVIRFMSAMEEAKVFSWKIEEIIRDNLLDKTSRHLMIITNADSGLTILVRNLYFLEKKPVVIFGSKFAEDQTEEYSYKTLNRIILCMEEGRILVLKDLDSIYGSLYDMLNQNYTTVGKKKNCRIALGPYSNPMCQVQDNFRCIVLVDERKVNYSDPPFLNRFEKQLLRFEDIISADQLRIIKQMLSWAEDFSYIPDHPFRKEHAFSGMNDDTIPSLVYVLTAGKEASDEEVIKACKNALLWLVPPDAVFRLSQSKLASKDISEVDQIQKTFARRPVHCGLSLVLETIINDISCDDLPPNLAVSQSFGARLIIFTFSNILVDMQMALKKFDVLVQKLGAYKSEKELSKQLKHFFQSDTNLLVLQCKPSDDSDHIPLAKFLLEEMQQTYCSADRQKHICLICHMERSSDAPVLGSWQFNFLSGWQLLTVDAVEDQGLFPLIQVDNWLSSDPVGHVMPILQHGIVELLESSFKPVEQCIRENIVWAFTCTSSISGERPIKEFAELIKSMLNSHDMLRCLSSAVLEIIKCTVVCEACEDKFDPRNWQSKVAFDLQLLQTSTSFVDALRCHLTSCVTTPLANIIHKLELLSALHSYFVNTDDRHVWEKLFHHLVVLQLHETKVPRGLGCFQIPRIPLKFECPFSQHFIDGICKYEEFFENDFVSAKMNSGNLACQNELSSECYMRLFCQYRDLFKHVFSKFPEVLELYTDELVKDLCNHFSFGISLEEHERIALMRWMCRTKAYNHDTADAITTITETVLCIWQYADLCQSLLRLVSQCRARLPSNIQDVLSDEEMQQRNPVHKSVSGAVSADRQLVDDVAGMKLSEVDFVPVETEIGLPSRSTDLSPEISGPVLAEACSKFEFACNDEEKVVEVDGICGVGSSAKYNEMDYERNCSDTLPVCVVGRSYKDNTSAGMEHVDVFSEDTSSKLEEDVYVDFDVKSTYENGKKLEELTIYNGLETESDMYASTGALNSSADSERNNETLPSGRDGAVSGESILLSPSLSDETNVIKSEELRPEERLVEKLCMCLIPTTDAVRTCGGVLCWHNHVASVLSFSSSVSGYPTALHELRVFNDLANLMLSSSRLAPEKAERYLTEVADDIERHDDDTTFLDSVDVFSVLCTLTRSLRAEHITGGHTQAFLCSYISRCVDVNADKEVFNAYVKYQLESSVGEEGQFLYFGPIINRCLLESDENELFIKFCKLIDSSDIKNVDDNDYLILIDAALREETRNRDSLLVLCKDVIQRAVFDKYDWGELDFIDAADNILLTTFKAAVDVLDSQIEKPSLQTAAAAAYLSVFSSYLSSKLAFDCERKSLLSHRLLYSVVNSVYGNCSAVFMYFVLRKLQPMKNLIGLKRMLSTAKDVVPSLATFCLPEDDLLLSLGHDILGGTALHVSNLKQSLQNIHEEAEFVREYLNNMCCSADRLLSFIASLSEVCYLTRSVRSLKDTELQLVTWMKENATTEFRTLPRLHNLIQRLTAESSFGIDLLRLTPDSSYLHLLQASVLVHLTSVTITRQSENCFQFFWQCVDSPTAQAVKDVRQILHSQRRWHYVRDLKPYVFTVCKQCFCRSCSPGDLETCPFCETGGSLHSTKDESCVSYDEFCCNSPGQQVARDLLMLLLDGCLLSSLGLGIVEWVDLAPVFALEKTESGIASAVGNWRQIWMDVGNVLNCSDEDVAALIHNVLSKWNSPVAAPGIALLNEEQIRRSLFMLEEVVMQMVWRPSLRSDLRNYIAKILIKHEPPVRRILREVGDEEHIKPVARLMRSATAPSLRDMELQLYLTRKNQVHQVLALFFDSKHELVLLQHLLPVLKWSLMCRQFVSYELTRAECRDMTLDRLLIGRSEKERDCYTAFEESWKDLRSSGSLAVLSSIDNTLTALPAVHQRVTIQSVLLETMDSVIYKVLKALVHIQNSFLDKILTISLDGTSSAVGFLRRPKASHATSGHPTVNCIHLHNASKGHLVCLDDLTEQLVQFGQNDPLYGHGNQIYYNFTKIEMDLANLLVLNRAHLLMDGTFPTVVYANELFVSCAHILHEFKTYITQHPLSPAIISGIKEKQATNPDYVQKMMRQTEVLLSIVKKTGGSDQTIDSYIRTWHTSLPGGFAAQLLPTGGEPLRLCHLVALYECLESMQADIVVNTLPDKFKEPISDSMKEALMEFLEGRNIPYNFIEVAMKRFIIRNLVNFDIQHMTLDQPLANWITEPSLWPDIPGETKGSSEKYSPEGDYWEFPKMLNLSHAYSVLEYVKQILTENKKHVKWMPAPVKQSVESTAAKPAVHGARSRTRGKMNVT